MKTVIGIDAGISTTKIVGLRNGKVVSPIRITATDPVTSLYGAFGKYLHDNGIRLDDIEQVMLTGVGSAYIKDGLYGLPTGFSGKAKACWQYFSGAAYLFEYKGRLVMTDESLELTEYGDGSHEAPFGAPRGEFDTWEEVEEWLEAVFDDLQADDLL